MKILSDLIKKVEPKSLKCWSKSTKKGTCHEHMFLNGVKRCFEHSICKVFQDLKSQLPGAILSEKYYQHEHDSHQLQSYG